MLNMKEIGERIRKRRNELGLSVIELAVRVDSTRSNIYRYENGEIKGLNLEMVSLIAEQLGVNPDWLIGKTDIKYPEDEDNPITLTLTEVYNSLKYQLLYEGVVIHQDVPLNENEINVILQALRVAMKIIEEDRTSFDN